MKHDEFLLAKYWGEQIASLRRERVMTQEELAQAVGLSPRWLYMLEYGQVSGKLYTYERIIQVLGEDFEQVRRCVLNNLEMEK